jgi:tRNA threonylcarbamoyladenosine biosynthesis protein TsaB
VNILAFDSCFGALSVAVRWQSARGEWLIREEYEERQTGHAEAIVPMIDRVMSGAGLAFDRLDRIAVTHGPGTFTGVRIGVATARALALATKAQVVAVSSLAVMAFRADFLAGQRPDGSCLAVCVDARKDQLYVQIFGENAGHALTEPMLVSPTDVLEHARGRPLYVAGSGAPQVVAAAAERGVEVIAPPVGQLEPHARFLALLAPAAPVVDRAVPLYMRAPDAKPQAAAGPLLKH